MTTRAETAESSLQTKTSELVTAKSDLATTKGELAEVKQQVVTGQTQTTNIQTKLTEALAKIKTIEAQLKKSKKAQNGPIPDVDSAPVEDELEDAVSDTSSTSVNIIQPRNFTVPTFQGSSNMPPVSWGRVVKQLYRASGWTKEVAIARMYTAVKEPYLAILMTIVAKDESAASNDKKTVEEIVDAFVQEIRSSSTTIAIAQFGARKQRLNESASDFGIALKRLGTEAFQDIDNNALQNILLHKF